MNFYVCHFQSLTTFKATHGIDMWEVKHYNFARQSLSFFNSTYKIDQRPLKSKWSMVPPLDPFLSCQSRAILPKTIETWKTFCRHIWFDFFLYGFWHCATIQWPDNFSRNFCLTTNKYTYSSAGQPSPKHSAMSMPSNHSQSHVRLEDKCWTCTLPRFV